MTDKKTLDLARAFAKSVESRPGAYDEQVRAAAEVVSSLLDEWVGVDRLRKYISDWREGLATAPRGNYEAEMLDDLEDMLPALPAPKSAAPRHGDVPVGEPWQVEVDGQTAIGYRNDPQTRLCWSVVQPHNNAHHWLYDSDVTLIARLVPETTEQDDEHAFSPDYIYTDGDGDEWEYIDGRWITGDTHAERVAVGKARPGFASLLAEYGPYTRIEDTK